ncbi:hypothetical protein POSPLADRAFT_1033238 [Postia placenta MAD-698-R-SB12]|uniref:Uncharacterized protein n=1 Tax=Postia placenta MAD-698-R-SB12 TaxID=670580 RepID=A0A1X6N535_9APHY|nr:hypothetical protein POSPLADRAFT_1033238 [Postia placenta MAD-698-R-SB12]OSX63714.1 hypothetical protein POSPLADRAFT_1033238 [Postia placenta MAD-698-R-SB12]
MQFKYLTVVFAAWASLLVAASALPQPEPTRITPQSPLGCLSTTPEDEICEDPFTLPSGPYSLPDLLTASLTFGVVLMLERAPRTSACILKMSSKERRWLERSDSVTAGKILECLLKEGI